MERLAKAAFILVWLLFVDTLTHAINCPRCREDSVRRYVGGLQYLVQRENTPNDPLGGDHAHMAREITE
jgi:hypothetical protein